MEKKLENLEFLQSALWRQFQTSVGRKTFCLEREGFLASVIEHSLPLVGKYWYCPRGPVFFAEVKKNLKSQISNSNRTQISNENQKAEIQNTNSEGAIENGIQQLVKLARKEKAGWIRIEPESEEMLKYTKDVLEEIRPRRTDYRIVKAPHDMQPKEIFVIDITKDAETLLSEMKPKTRYNIRLSQKHKVSVKAISNFQFPISNEYVEAFLKLTKEMASRHGITAHPEQYYRKMLETLPTEMLKIYVAEFEGKIIAANLVLFYGKTATYLHGASGNEQRKVMAPFLLQWQAILDAKELGFEKYDFGGIKTMSNNQQSTDNKNTWEGITTFKLGFSPNTTPVQFPGSYDIVVNPRKYGVYRGLQRAKGLMVRFRK